MKQTNLKINPIKPNQQGADVYVLHQVLSAFGLTVSGDDLRTGVAGGQTQKKVVLLQRSLGIPPSTGDFLLDEKTISALGKAMLNNGWISSSTSFTASGTVKSAHGKMRKNQKLIAFDLDLLGVGVYKDLKNEAAILKNNTKGGFEYLGEAVTDSKGHYSFTFFEFQYRRAEGGKGEKADIVVFAMDDKKNIVGRSELINLESYDQKGFVRGVDIVLESKEEKRSEYQVLIETLTPFFKENNIDSFAEIAKSNDQISFTASELDLDLSHLRILADVYTLLEEEGAFAKTLELLYGLGRQDISLSWEVLFKHHRDALQAAIGHSVESHIIAKPNERVLSIFLDVIQAHAIAHVLNDTSGDKDNQLNLLLSTALPKKPQRLAFLKAVNEFEGSDFPKFWKELEAKPEFDKGLVSSIQLTQHLHALTNFQPLIKELQITRGIKSVETLVDLSKKEWEKAIKIAGVPDFIEGENKKEKTERYAEVLESQINAAFPTQRIAKMIADGELVFKNAKVKRHLSAFLKEHKDFDFKSTQIHKYIEKNKDSLDASTLEELSKELMELQRLFQVSTSPLVLKVLRENKLSSAYAIANIPRENFIRTYGVALGGDDVAITVHNRGQHMARRSEMIATTFNDASSHAGNPVMVMSSGATEEAKSLLETKIPNYKNLFGSPDLCECEHCRSLLSPAAYFVELLQFLEKSTYRIEKENGEEERHSPYEYLVGSLENNITGRRPDLAKLELSCENTNTLIPYIDLSNEVMESYVVAGSLETYNENIKDVTADELRANPQHTNAEAYRILSNNHEPEGLGDKKTAIYPFNLPFHQPLSVIRTYSDFLNVSRYETLLAVNPEAEGATQKAIAAEALSFCEEEYRLLVGEDFEGIADDTELYQLFGYDNLADLNNLIKIGHVQKFMAKTQISYVELVELVHTKYINPYQSTVAYLDTIFSETLSVSNALYKWLEKVAVGEISESEPPVVAAIEEYNTNRAEGEPEITRDELVTWAEDNFDGYRQVITLFEHYSACNLDTTRLRSIQGIEKFPDDFDDEAKLIFGEAKIELEKWSRFHDFIRLWKKLGWGIHEIDLILTALDQVEVTPETIMQLESVILLQKASNLPLLKLAVLWGDIDTYGDRSLYKKLFLNKAIQEIDTVFIADAQGNYFKNTTEIVGSHQSTIMASFRITAEELDKIMTSASLDETAMLSLENLSTIYGYVVLAGTLKLQIKDLLKLIDLFGTSSMFDLPQETLAFFKLATSAKEHGFKPATLDYIFNGNASTEENIALDNDKIKQVAQSIYDDLTAPEVEKNLQQDMLGTHLSEMLDLSEISTLLLMEKDIDEIMDTVLDQDIHSFTDKVTILHRAALFISGFKLSETEVKHFIDFSSDFGGIDFSALTAENWKRIRDYVALRNAVPQGQALLTDVFTLANNPDLTITIEEQKEKMLKLIFQATGWDKKNVVYLTEDYFKLLPKLPLLTLDDFNNFKNEINFWKILNVINIVTKTGLSAETSMELGAVSTDFANLHTSAQTLKNAVKAKYSNTEWLEVAGGLSDKIREQQKQALISYVLVQDTIKDAGVKDADGLFEHLLIDVQMGACMDTSRIVQANATIQLFVNRILLNLEDPIPVESIDTAQWEWMKNYRIWEANRKVFLHPENWLEPEWRTDRSEFFKDLESHLLQNDITQRSVEQGLRNYLMSMDEVSNLDVCGMHEERYEDGRMKFLHVFGRTHNLPYKYYYRRWNEYEKWSTWEKVAVDIRNVEDGADSGVHLIPVVWKGRLFLFWPEFMEKVKPADLGGKTVSEIGGGGNDPDPYTVDDLSPKKYWEIRLAWSEYVDGAWNAKQVSKEYSDTKYHYTGGFRELPTCHEDGDFTNLQHFRFTPKISKESNILSITVNYEENRFPWFEIIDIQSPIIIRRSYCSKNIKAKAMMLKTSGSTKRSSQYSNFYMSSMKPLKLLIQDEGYFKTNNSGSWKLTGDRYYSGNMILNNQFFIANKTKNYFAKSKMVTIIDRLKKPDYLAPLGNKLLAINTSSRQHMNPHADVLDLSVANTSTTSIPFSPVDSQKRLRSHTSKELAFHVFHHPFTSQLVTNLDSIGLSGLMSSNTSIQSDDGAAFESYEPNFRYGFVHETSSSDTCTGYEETICFDKHDANSQYNWELFFHAPLYIATRLSKNGKYKEAMQWFHYIFDPTTNEKALSEDDTARYWKVKPFKAESAKIESLGQWFRKLQSNDPENTGNKEIDEWRKNPFDPHLVASNRPVTYMKHVVIKYIENLMAWGDSLFRQFTRESVYEAIQLYVIASHVLGKRPEKVPKRGKIKTETYANLKNKLDDFGNALVELENLFPYSGGVNNTDLSTSTNILGMGEALYFCIPANAKLLEYWDTVADRLFKIRHCQDIDGVERNLALFAPVFNPEDLIKARSQGLSLGSILADLSSPPPLYRFTYLVQKANEFCNDVKALGSSILSAIEKKDAEELGRLRASQEIGLLEQVTAIRERQVLSARTNKENLLTSRDTAKSRLEHYTKFLGNNVTVPDAPDLEATLSAHSDLPKDTKIDKIDTGLTEELTGSQEKGATLIAREKEELKLNNRVKHINIGVNSAETLAATLNAIPTFKVFGAPLGMGAGTESGGFNWANGVSAGARAARGFADYYSTGAILASRIGGYLLREDDRAFQANNAIREIISLDKQITSADIQIQIAKQELKNHKQQIINAQQTEDFLRTKFSNQELYQWMKEKISSVYKQSYNLAYEMAKKAEKSYQRELGIETSSFIQYGYWDNAKQGLISGEKLQLALRQLENAFLNNNQREYELSKHISLSMLDPLALVKLRTTGVCDFDIPEALYDMDHAGQYFRRIKSVSISIPCITGPYTSVSAKLSLVSNKYRNDTNTNNGYMEVDDDSRFTKNIGAIQSIATSSSQNDSGVFELNFRDERYLPFEGTGAISSWRLELPTEVRQFDYDTISDVILHVKYTAREGGSPLKSVAETNLNTRLAAIKQDLSEEGLHVAINMRHDMSTAWHLLKTDGKVNVNIDKSRLPYFVQSLGASIEKVIFIAKLEDTPTDYKLTIKSNEITLKDDDLSVLNKGEISTIGLDETFEISGDVSKLEELLMVVNYKFT